MNVLAHATNSTAALDEAEWLLRSSEVAVAWNTSSIVTQLRILGEGLYQTIRMKLSVPQYAVRRLMSAFVADVVGGVHRAWGQPRHDECVDHKRTLSAVSNRCDPEYLI